MVEQKFEKAKSDMISLNLEVEENKATEIIQNVLSTFNLMKMASQNDLLSQVYQKNPFLQYES